MSKTEKCQVQDNFRAYTYLSKDALLSGLDSLGVDAFHSALSYAGLLSGEDAAEATRNAISFPVDAGVVAAGAEISDLTGALNDLKTLFTSALSAAATEEEEKDAGYLLLSTIGAHADVINGLRKHAEQNGPMADQSQVINNLQTSASALLPQLFDVATGLSDVDDTSDLVEKVYDLGNDYGIRFAGLFTEMASLIDDMAEYLSGSELNSYRAALTKHILNADAFESVAASVDTDNDGLPDFYDATATAADIAASALTEDTDVDGDGTNDSMDATPFYAEI